MESVNEIDCLVRKCPDSTTSLRRQRCHHKDIRNEIITLTISAAPDMTVVEVEGDSAPAQDYYQRAKCVGYGMRHCL